MHLRGDWPDLLTARHISQGYGRHTVIRGLTVELCPGVTALLGPNGSGKTTLLRTLATVQPPLEGILTVDGRDISSERSARAARRQIGYLPQRFGFEPGMRVRDFVRYAAWQRGLPPGDWSEATARALDHVGLTAEASTKMGRLSGGMRQRAAIAWAIVGEPRVVLLDEPTVGLDPQQRMRFRDIISSLSDTTVLLSTHLIDDVDAICSRVVVMNGGKIHFAGSIDELKALDDLAMSGHTPLERAYMSLLPPEDRDR